MCENKLTKTELHIVLSALRIAVEDGSIYGGRTTDKSIEKMNDAIETIERKLKAQ